MLSIGKTSLLRIHLLRMMLGVYLQYGKTGDIRNGGKDDGAQFSAFADDIQGRCRGQFHAVSREVEFVEAEGDIRDQKLGVEARSDVAYVANIREKGREGREGGFEVVEPYILIYLPFPGRGLVRWPIG